MFSIKITPESDWKELITSLTNMANEPSKLKDLTGRAVALASKNLYDLVMQKFESGVSGWPLLAEVTKSIKKSDKFLVNTGDFKNSITMRVSGLLGEVGILVPKGPHGQDLEVIARVIEGGAVIPVTDKMRNWFAAKGYPLRSTTTVIMVPARPLFGPSLQEFELHLDEILGPLIDELVKEMGL